MVLCTILNEKALKMLRDRIPNSIISHLALIQNKKDAH